MMISSSPRFLIRCCQLGLALLVMQSLDNAMAFVAKRDRQGRVTLQTQQDPEHPNPTFIREGFDAAMKRQKDAARAAWKCSGAKASDDVWFDIA